MRIHVTGNAGAGKTTLARRLGSDFNLPVFHLDKIVWGPNWTKTSPEDRESKIRKLIAGDYWVIEGVSENVRKEADLVIVLATPTYLCLYRCIKRCFQFGLRTRPELPENCPEIAILFRAVGIVWRFGQKAGRQILLESQRERNYMVCKSADDAIRRLKSAREPFFPTAPSSSVN